jgi:universal stress protein E
MKRILLASDLSQRSRRALRRAVALARQFDAELIALHVADDDLPDEMIAAECQAAEAAIREHLDAAGAEGLAPEPAIVTRAGDPFRVIVDEADGSKPISS